MIYYTGDIHGDPYEVIQFCDSKKLTEQDTLVLLGDVGANYPMMSWPHIMRCYMVFGHIHGNTDADYWPLIQANERMLNAGVDVNHFEPVTFEEMEANNLLYKGQSKAGLEVQP